MQGKGPAWTGFAARLVAAAALLVGGLAGAGVLDHAAEIPELGSYDLVYSLDIPTSASFNGSAVPYTVNNAASVTDPYSRVAYYMELQRAGDPEPTWVYASMDRFSGDVRKIGVPNTTSGAHFRQNVANMNVYSNDPQIATGTGLTSGNIEFWPSNYGPGNDAGVPNADSGTFDFGDGGSNTGAGYGSMQIHNHAVTPTTGQTIFAYNHWGGGTADLGIGSRPSGHPDWTFAGNGGQYTVKSLEVLVQPDPTPISVFDNVPEANDYTLVYALPIPDQGGRFNADGVPYSFANPGLVTQPFDRVAYYLELQKPTDPEPEWVYVSMDAFTNDAAKIGVPATSTGAVFAQDVASMNVFSNVPSIQTGTGLTGGNIEFWPSNYNGNNDLGVPNATSAFDFGDGGFNGGGGHGSMQIHNHYVTPTTGQTLIGYSDWGGNNPNDPSEIGIGTNTTGTGLPDWTFSNSGLNYSVKNLYVLVRPGAAPAARLAAYDHANIGGAAYAVDPGTGDVRGPVSWKLEKLNGTVIPGVVNSEWYFGYQATSTDAFLALASSGRPHSDFALSEIAWSNGNYPPETGFSGDMGNFSTRFFGQVLIPDDPANPGSARTVSFHDYNDDWAVLLIDGALTDINDGNWTSLNGTGGATATLDLDPGWHDFEFFQSEGGGGDNARLAWDFDPVTGLFGGSFSTITSDYYRYAIPELLAEGTYNVGSPTTDGIFFNIGSAPGETFEMRLTVDYGGWTEVAYGEFTGVPEPTTCLLLGGGLLALVRRRRRRAC